MDLASIIGTVVREATIGATRGTAEANTAAFMASTAGLLEATSETKKKYWSHWETFAKEHGFQPYLDGPGDDPDGQTILRFAVRVRRGCYGRGKRVRVGAQRQTSKDEPA